MEFTSVIKFTPQSCQTVALWLSICEDIERLVRLPWNPNRFQSKLTIS